MEGTGFVELLGAELEKVVAGCWEFFGEEANCDAPDWRGADADVQVDFVGDWSNMWVF